MPKTTSCLIFPIFLSAILAGCGGGGGSASSTSLSDTANTAVAAQVADIAPSNAVDTVSVFVALDNSNAVSGVSDIFQTVDEQRIKSQKNFLNSLQINAIGSIQAANGTTCATGDLATRINQAHTPNSGNAVRIDLNACELDLLPKLKGVAAVHADIPMSTQSITSSTVSKTNDTIKVSFNGVVAQPTINSHVADGTAQVIALMDSGVDERHPALSNNKVLPGACFSTPTNGGHGFCPNAQSVDTTSSAAGRSCADMWSGTRAEAIQAGCGHGTGMAAAASMNYNVGGVIAKGMAPSAQIIPVQVFSETITTTSKSISTSAGDLLAGIEWVTSEAQRRRSAGLAPIVAMNMSLGGGSYTTSCDSDYVGSLFKTAFANLRNQGVLPIVASGNGGAKNSITFPACVSNTVSVAAAKLGYNGLATYSNFSSQTKLIAIGGDVDGSGRYALPVLCSTVGNFDCWQEVAGTSPATALTSGGVAALYSLNAAASLSNVESVLTTDIAALGLSNSSALNLNVNDGSQNYVRPALRITSSGYRLLDLTETNGSNAVPPPTNTSPIITLAQICLYGRPNYLGAQACATQAYGSNATTENKDLFYRFAGKIGSIRITDVQSKTDLPANKATVTLYTALNTNSQSGYVSASTTDTTHLTIFNNPTIRMVRIQTQ
jgi:hypothetical protein